MDGLEELLLQLGMVAFVTLTAMFTIVVYVFFVGVCGFVVLTMAYSALGFLRNYFGFGQQADPAENLLQVDSPLKTMIVLGSGGHTTEMLNLVRWLSRNFYPRVYVTSHTDGLSMRKALDFETMERFDNRPQPYDFRSIVRIREVGEGLCSVIWRAPFAVYDAATLLYSEKPQILLCNGPGVCIPVVLMSYLLNALQITRTKIVFVESICRVNELSMTGSLVAKYVDDFIVQWPQLRDAIKDQYPEAQVHYLGRLS